MDNLKKIEDFINDRFRMDVKVYSLELNDNGDYRFKTRCDRLGKFVIPLGFTVYAITPDYIMFTLSNSFLIKHLR